MCHRAFSVASGVGLLAYLLAVGVTVGAEAEGLEADLAVLRDKSVPSDGAGLLAFFKKRTMSDVTRKKIVGLINSLGDDDFATREKATTELIDIGAAARPQLSVALRDNDLEVRRRARRALDSIGPAAEETSLLPAAARVLAHRKPAGSAEVLLDFLPNIEDTDTAEVVARIVAQVALDRTGTPERAVLLALSDRQWIKRYAAAEALAHVAGQRAAVRKLLQDPDSGVRRRVAMTLLHAHDKQAVPALIALLGAPSSEDAGAAEEMLTILAGEKAPRHLDDDSPTARERYRKQWERWWKEAGETIDLAKIDLDAAGRGYTLLAFTDLRNMGKLQEQDAGGRVRWTINNLNYPIHAHKIRRDRVLICEYTTNMVTERDLKGKLIWEKRVPGQPISAQRLPNGNTFIATRQQLMEVDKSGREVKTIATSVAMGGFIIAAERHKDGTFTVINRMGTCMKLDREGRQTRLFSIAGAGRVRAFPISGLKCDFLPKGGLLVPDYMGNAIREYDATGNLVWEKTLAPLARPTAVTRLPNGHTLVGSMYNNRIFELDKDGKEVSSKPIEGRIMFLDRR